MFDPYWQWLQISPDFRPPTYYQLLGVAPQERDPQVIEAAAQFRTALLLTHRAGPHAAESSRLLNEVVGARTTLLDPRLRQEYDAKLENAPPSVVLPRRKPSQAARSMPWLSILVGGLALASLGTFIGLRLARPPVSPSNTAKAPSTSGALATKPGPVDRRWPVPDAAAQEKAEKLIKDLFKDDYAKTAAADRRALAATLQQQAQDTRDDLAAHFVLLREARDLAARGADPNRVLQVVDQLSEEYVIDGSAMKIAALALAGRSIGAPTEYAALIKCVMPLVDAAVAADHFAVAMPLLNIAATSAPKGADEALVAAVTRRSKEVGVMQQEYEGVQPALDVLQRSPADAGANLAVGKYRCFIKGDWDTGLPMLARGSDARLQSIARKELTHPEDGAAQVELGDAWWDLAEATPAPAKIQLLHRARFWYQKAAPKLKGLTRTKVDKRLADMDK